MKIHGDPPQIIGVVLVLFSILFGLAAMWWWAINGMSKEAAEATMVTVGVLAGLGIIIGS